MFIIKMRTIFVALLLAAGTLSAEVQSVAVRFNQNICQPQCQEMFKAQLLKIEGVKGATIDGITGQAILAWDPKKPFTYFPIRRAMQWVGIGLEKQGLIVKIRGKLSVRNNNQVVLISEGDSATFTLVSPAQPQQGDYTTLVNFSRASLSKSDFDRLSAIAKTNGIVIIQGPLLDPDRSPPLLLLLANLTTENA